MGEADTVDVAASVERFRPALLRLARELAGQDAEDLLQDATVRALRRAHQLRTRSVLRWLQRIVVTTAADRRRAHVRIPLAVGIIETQTAEPPAQIADTIVRAEQVAQAMAAAGPEGARMFRLAADGNTYREIASACGCTVHHVRYRLADSRTKARGAEYARGGR